MVTLTERLREFLLTRLGAELPANALATFGLRVAQVGLEFVILLLLAQVLGATAFGIYAIAMACATVLGVPAAAGFDRLLIREVAVLRAGERWGALRGVLRSATRISLLAATLLALVLAAVATWGVGDAGSSQALLLAAVLLPCVAFARLRQATIQGLGRVPTGLFPETIVQPAAMLLFSSLAFLALGMPRTGAVAMAIQILAALLAMIVGAVLLRRHWPQAARQAAPVFETARWWRSAAPLMWMLGMNMVLTGADVIMLGWLLDEKAAGQYRVAAQLAMLVSFPMTAINLAIAPVLARLNANGEAANLRTAATRASRWSLLAAVPIALLLVVAGKLFLGLFGEEFDHAYTALVVLVLGYVVNSFSGSAGYLLIMTGHERLAAWMFSAAALLNIVANYLLIPVLGITGAAVATSASLVMVAMGLWYFSRREVA